MSKIYDLTTAYRLSKNYITFTFRRFYGEFIILGKENIPSEGPVIFAPNHTNALMDALAVAASVPSDRAVVFLARADLFRNKKVAWILNFAKIMPAFRMRDGVENLGRNAEIFERCIEVLDHEHTLCIMPEGNQEVERKLRPLAKGIFRIAFAAQEKFGSEKNVKIVPVGLDFGDNIKQGKHIIINFGKPIEVSGYMAEYTRNPVNATNHIRKKLRDELCSISLHLDSAQHYHTFEMATEVCCTPLVTKLQLKNDTTGRYFARLKAAGELVALEKHHRDKILRLETLCNEYFKSLANLKIKNHVVEKAPYKQGVLIRTLATLMLTLPIFIYGILANFLPYFSPVWLRKKVFKPAFTGFYSSLHYGLGIITFPIFYAIQTLLFATLINLPWWYSIALLASFYPAGKCALLWSRTTKKLFGRWRHATLTQNRPDEILRLQAIRKEIIDTVL